MHVDKNPFERYEVVLVRRGDLYKAVIRELNLTESGPDPASACKALTEKYAAQIDDMIEAGFADELPAASSTTNPFSPFLIRATVIACVIVLVLFSAFVSFNSIVGRVETAAHTVSQSVSVRPLLVKLRKEIISLSDASPKRRREISAELRQFVIVLKPILDELRPLLETNSDRECARECLQTVPKTLPDGG